MLKPQISKKTSTESNEADEIYLPSKTSNLYIIFQHIDKPFYLKILDAMYVVYKNHKYSLTDNQFIKRWCC